MTKIEPKDGFTPMYAVEYLNCGESITSRALFETLGDARRWAEDDQSALFIFTAFFNELYIEEGIITELSESEPDEELFYNAEFVEKVGKSEDDKVAEIKESARKALESAGDEWNSDTVEFFADVLRAIIKTN